MAYGFKRVDFLAFFLFPRTWREIQRLERINKQQAKTIDRFAQMIEDLGGDIA